MPWYRGNFHCHSTNSDGAASPAEVVRYYRAIGMDFVAISDHNRLTGLEEYGPTLDSGFPGVPSCEFTGPKSCHVLAVDVNQAVAPAGDRSDSSPAEILQEGIDRTRAAGGVPVLCHPCWNWAYDEEVVLGLTSVTHFEVYNASPDCNSYPGFGRSGPEQIWDRVLSAGLRVFGVATDDAHWHESPAGAKRLPTHLMGGGLGWSVIRSSELSRPALREAFEAGHFYASTGVELGEYRVTADSIELTVKPWSHEHAVVEFVGRDGALLERSEGLEASYRFRGDERYVRARIADTTGCYALTQPVFLDALDEAITWTGDQNDRP